MSLPPAHPSLPSVPRWTNNCSPSQPQTATQQAPLTSSAYSSHYAQAYNNSLTSWQEPKPTPVINFSPTFPFSGPAQYPPRAPLLRPGETKCTYKNCTFSGGPKPLEIHMMDRHLIYPPDWHNRKPKPDWDADPSLKGKPITIQGTNISLDSPEVLDAWIAERKKRWPTASRVDDKKKRLQDAVDRGQLVLNDSNLFGRKKRKVEADTDRPREERTPSRGRGRGRAGAPTRGRATDTGWRGRGRGTSTVASHGTRPIVQESSSDSSSSDSGDDSDSPEIASSKAPPPPPPPPPPPENVPADILATETNVMAKPNKARDKKPAPQPRPAPHNPFASRPTLLRNLLLPEIRMTVSNLSQAIRFLVDNEFLDNVEFKPGQAEERMIEVVPAAPIETTQDTVHENYMI